jgi:hypothetical protein
MINFRPIANDLAAALRVMPCTCVTKQTSWPFKPVEHEDKPCRRCAALLAFDAATQEKAA